MPNQSRQSGDCGKRDSRRLDSGCRTSETGERAVSGFLWHRQNLTILPTDNRSIYFFHRRAQSWDSLSTSPIECRWSKMSPQNLVPKLLLGVVAIVVALPLFWLFGGIRWLDTQVFPPQRPKNMPENSVWIEAPALPVSWHHGWWFGCDMSSSGTTHYCRLVAAEGQEVCAGEYLPCGGKSPVPLSSMGLVPTPHSIGMWIADKRLAALAPIGVLRSGDILLPVVVLDRCDKFKADMHR